MMGSGSYGGGGAGRGGGGAGHGGRGYRFQDGEMISAVQPLSKVEEEVKRILGKLSKEYIMKLFCSPIIRSAYEQLFELSVHVFQNKSWQGVTDRYGVTSNTGCLMEWVGAVIARFQATEQNQKVRDIARVCLDDFLMLALENDLNLYVSGSSTDVLNKLNREVFNSTSAYFLGSMIWRVLEREKENLTESGELQIRQVAQVTADRIIHSFKNKFYAREQTTYRDLFRVIQENTTWFLEQLR